MFPLGAIHFSSWLFFTKIFNNMFYALKNFIIINSTKDLTINQTCLFEN